MAMTSSTSPVPAMRRAASLGCCGKAGCGPTRSAARSSAASSRGNAKWAAWSPWRWPISRLPSRNESSPRSPWVAVTPGHEVTSAVICSLAEGMAATLRRDASCGPGDIGPTTSAVGAQAGEREVVEVELEAEQPVRDGAELRHGGAVERLAAPAPLALRGGAHGRGGRPARGAAGPVRVADDACSLQGAEVAVDGRDVAGASGRELLGRARRPGGVEALEQPPPRRREPDALGAERAERGGERRGRNGRSMMGDGHGFLLGRGASSAAGTVCAPTPQPDQGTGGLTPCPSHT